jgi:hypothetical protein
MSLVGRYGQEVRLPIPRCGTCDGRNMTVTKDMHYAERGYSISFACHGEVETIFFSEEDLLGRELPVPKVVFLRNWAAYTIRPKPAEGRRL